MWGTPALAAHARGARQRAGAQGDPGADEGTAEGLDGAVGAGSDERGGAGGGHRDEPREEGGALGADPLHADVPAHEADDGDDHGLPKESQRLDGVGPAQPCGAVEEQPRDRRLHGGDRAHRGGQQPRSQRAQYGHGQDREADLADQRAHGEGDAGAVRATPALDRERAHGDERRPVQDRPLRPPPPVQQGHDHGHHHRRAADEDTGDRRFGRPLGGDDGQVEADHADGGEDDEAGPLTPGERAQPGRGAPSGERDEQETGEAVAQELAAGVRVVAEQAVGGEGSSDEDAGERGEEGTAHGGGVHGSDARNRRGPD